MSMDDEPLAPDDGAADSDVEWAFFGVHDIEYWVVRGGRLVPADAAERERIAERERERSALPRLRRWEREQRHARLPDALGRVVWWCRGLLQRGAHVRAVEPRAAEGRGHSMPRRRTDVAQR